MKKIFLYFLIVFISISIKLFAESYIIQYGGNGGGGSGDNLGNHTATQNLNMTNHNIINVSTISAKNLNIENSFSFENNSLIFEDGNSNIFLEITTSSMTSKSDGYSINIDTANFKTIKENGIDISQKYVSTTTWQQGEIVFIIGDGVNDIQTGVYGWLPIYECEIIGWELTADTNGSIVIDIWKDSYDNFPPTNDDSITGSEKPTLSSQQKNRDLNLTTWTTSCNSDDYLMFNVNSVSNLKRCILKLYTRRKI